MLMELSLKSKMFFKYEMKKQKFILKTDFKMKYLHSVLILN